MAKTAGGLRRLVFFKKSPFFIYKIYPNGGMIRMMKGLDKKKPDYSAILTIARSFASKGSKVDILKEVHYKDRLYGEVFGSLITTKYYRKCPDIRIDGKFYEYEGFVGAWNKKKIKNMLKHGSEQSDRLIIKNTRGCSDRFIRKSIANRKDNQNKIKEVWILEKGKLRLFFEDGEFKKTKEQYKTAL